MSHIDDLIKQLCPDGVEFKELGEVGEFVRGNGLQKKDFTPEGMPCIHYGQIYTYYGVFATQTKTFISNDQWNRLKRAKTGSLIVATTSENADDVCKAVAWMGSDEVAVSGDAYIYSHKLDPKYVSYFFQSTDFNDQKKKRITGTKVLRVSGDSLSKIRIPVPPMEVQKEIVKILDAFTELTAELGAELGAELEARRNQYIHYRDQLLTFTQTPPQKVRWMTLGNLVNFTNGKPHERLVDPEGEIALMTSRFISTQGKSARYVFSSDVLSPAAEDEIAMVMSDLPNGRALARAYFVDRDGRYAANQRVCLLQVSDTDLMYPKFLFYVVDRNPQLLAFDSGADQTHLKKADILGIKIPVPPLEEQVRIVEILDKFDALVNDISIGLPAEIEARRKQYEYYRDKLLTFKEAA